MLDLKGNGNMKIEFSTDSAAFYDEYADKVTNDIYKRDEIILILKRLIKSVEHGKNYGPIMDINGNKIGTWEM